MITPARRIAVVRALQLGDMLVAVPALRALRAGYPHAEITLIGLPWATSFAARLDSYVNLFLSFPGWSGIDEVSYDEARTERFIAEARAHDYDLVVQMHGSGGQSNPFALALGGRVTAGYYDGPHPLPLSLTRERGVGGEGILWPAAPYPHDQPEVLRNLGLTALLGCPDHDTALEFPLSGEDDVEVNALLGPLASDDRPLIGIHAGARPPARRWPPARFAAVADDLARRHGARIILIGGPGEEEIVAAVAKRMNTRALNLSGRTSLGGLAALLARLDLFIGNDSGPAHLAEAVGAPTVRLFGPADVDRWAPLDRARHAVVRHPVACSPCGYWECPIDHRCLRRIAPADVTRAADGLLAGRASGHAECSLRCPPVHVEHKMDKQRQQALAISDSVRSEVSQRNHAREGLCGA